MIETVLVLLLTSFLAVTLVQRIGLSPILGFIIAGLLVGPDGFGILGDNESIRQMGEIGIVFLMFTIGLEFSLSRLVSQGFELLVLGGLQVLLSAALFALATYWFWPESALSALTIGMALAMSSTAIVSRLLVEGSEANSSHGRIAICILLFQDLATIAFLTVMPVLDMQQQGDTLRAIAVALVKGALVFLVLLFAGRLAVQRTLRYLARLRSPESSMLAVLAVGIGGAWFAHTMGLSLALGGFMAGLVIGETEFRHQVEADIRPFQDVLLGLFFITIGMLVDLDLLGDIWPQALAATLLLVLAKALLAYGLARSFSLVAPLAAHCALMLANAGEFGLMLVFLAQQLGLIAPGAAQFTLATILLSMLIAPLLIRHSGSLAWGLTGMHQPRAQRGIVDDIESAAHDLSGHVILCGYGRVGHNIAWYLDREGVEFIALDTDLQQLYSADETAPVRFGDASQRVVLIAAGLLRAQAVVVSFDDVAATLKTLAHVRAVRPDITAIVRAPDERHIDALLDAGATEVIPDMFEISLTLATHVLTLLGVPITSIMQRNERIRADRYRLLRGLFDRPPPPRNGTRVRIVTLREGDHGVGRRLRDLPTAQLGVRVTAIRRHAIRGAAPDPQMRLAVGDALILSGTPVALARFEAELLYGGDDRQG